MPNQELQLRVAHLDCDSDAAAIRRGLERVEGISDLQVYPKAAKVALRFDEKRVSADAIKTSLRDLGFPVHEGPGMAETPKPWKNPKVITSVASGVLLLAGWLIGRAGASETVTLAIYIVSAVIGAYYFAREAVEDLLFERRISIEMLMTVGATVAIIMGEAMEGAMLAFLYSISEAAEGYTEEKTRSAIRKLMDLTPKRATVRRDGREVEIPVEELQVGDIFIVRPGEALATDGEVIGGRSSVNQAPVTGESVPVEKTTGDPVFAGSINEEGSLEVRATKTFANNTIARIIEMVEEAQERKGTSERFIERFGRRYSPAVLAIGVLVAIVPPLLFDADWRTWITRATVFIVAASPCALVIAIPITLVASLGTAARKGVLLKGGVYLEELAKVRVVALDKTGTITRGEPEVTQVVTATTAISVEEILARAAAVESRSQHPLARAIVAHATAKGVEPKPLDEFRSLIGAGAVGRIGNDDVYIGSPELFEGELRVGLDALRGEIERLRAGGNTVVIVGSPTEAWAAIAIRDNIRPNARAAIAALHAVGVTQVAMLTGDNETTARAIASEVGIDRIFANLKPEDKAVKVRELSKEHGHVAMVGDGVNDAPALAEATVGIAMGAAGTDVALETADVALMADDLEKLVYAIKLAKRNQSVVRQNLALSIAVILVFVTGAVLGKFTLPMAVLGHEFSEFIVIASGLRMLRS
ncbi:MAG TPA: cation-translocating P-type ATPase [Thermoanaerobaculia bacterium]|nr:cation-translocating P-type ATPase [Thermoanaerobaculia bacterium]